MPSCKIGKNVFFVTPFILEIWIGRIKGEIIDKLEIAEKLSYLPFSLIYTVLHGIHLFLDDLYDLIDMFRIFPIYFQ